MQKPNNIEQNQKELKTILNLLTTKQVPKYNSLLEVCPDGQYRTPCQCASWDEVDEQIEKVAELEDQILELKEKIIKLEKNNNKLQNDGLLALNNNLEILIKKFITQKYIIENLFLGFKRFLSKTGYLKREEIENRKKIDVEMSILIKRDEENEIKLEEMKKLNKKLKNEVLDLKGAIRVFCRIRPSSENNSCGMNTDGESLELSIENKKDVFLFDKVFGPNDNQCIVYEEIRPMIQSGFDGYNICVFAYGQTGSGKTFTMEGYKKDGIIYKALDSIYESKLENENEGWKIELKMSVVEIYNENVFDLLENIDKKVEIKYVNGALLLHNCIETEIVGKDEIDDLLKKANGNRSVSATKSNERSSRSHLIFMLKLKMEREDENRESFFTFIDLAGSERLSVSKAEGDRKKETQNINRSLSALANVVTALVRKDQHIPFRDSKLTYLLMGFLQSNSRVLMIVNVAPEKKHHSETICSLRFASNVSDCKLGTVKKNFNKRV